MLVTKLHHACLLIESGRTRLLVDPGALGSPAPLDGVDGILITHGHHDHLDPVLVRRALEQGIPVWAPPDAVAQLGEHEHLHAVAAGETLTVGELRVEAAGDRHAEVHPQIPGPENRAYLVGGAVFVTGDAHPQPPAPFQLLATPIDAPWLRATDLIRYVQRLRPAQVVGVHDGLLNEDGLEVAALVAASLERSGAGSATVLPDGGSVAVAVAD